MDPNQRTAIEDLKQEKAKYVQLLAELQARKNSVPAACGRQQQEALKLQQLASTYRHKAQEEQQMLAQIEQQLHKARQQLEHQRKQHSVSGAAVQQGVPAAKCCVALQERLSQKKQQLDEAVSRNKALRSEVEDLSKRGTAAQQLHDKLRRQLADAEADLAQVQQLVDVTEQAQQQAAALAEQLRLHDDAEELAISEAEKQLQAILLTKQQAHASEQQQNSSTQHACHLTGDEASAILEQLAKVCDAAGAASSCPKSSAAEEANSSNWSVLLQQVQQLQVGNAEQFRQCMLANHHLEQLQPGASWTQD